MNDSSAAALVFIAAFALVLGIVIVINFARYQSRKLKSEERLTAIAKGVLPPPDDDVDSLVETAGKASALRCAGSRGHGLRTGGIICVSAGVGMALFSFFLSWILQEHDVLAVAAAGLIPLTIGAGLLIDYVFRNRLPRSEVE